MAKKSRSLQGTLFRVTIIPTIAVTLILLGVILVSANLLVSGITEHHEILINALSREGDRYLAETERLMLAMADAMVDLAPEQKADLLADFRRRYPRFTAFYLLDGTGQVLAEDTDAFALTGLDLSREQVFGQARDSERTVFSDPFISPTTWQIAVTGAAPITSGGRFQGVLVGELNLELLQQDIEQADVGEQAVSFIVDRRGILVAHPNQAWVQEQRNVGDMGLVQQALAGQRAFELFYDDEQGTWMVGSARPMSGNWIVATTQPAWIVARPLLTLVVSSLVALSISFLLFFFAQMYSLRQINAPISMLAEKAGALSRGEYEALPVEQMGEFTELVSLGKSFNRMVEAVQERDRFLEKRVADRTHRLEIAASLGERLNTILDPNELLAELVSQIEQNFGYYFVCILLIDERREYLVIKEVAGQVGTAFRARDENIRLDAAKSLSARAARQVEVVRVDDVRQADDWLYHSLLPDTLSEIAVPISIEGQVIGVLDVQEDTLAAFDTSDADLFRSLANHVGTALHNARLYSLAQQELAERQKAEESLRQAYAEMEDLVAARTAELVAANEALRKELQERQKAQEALRESETKYQDLFESANDAILLIHHSRIVDCNSQATVLFGGSREQLLGQDLVQLSPLQQPDGRVSEAKAQEKLEAALTGQPQRFEWTHYRFDGSLFDVEVSLNRTETGGEAYLQAIERDITEQKRLEAQFLQVQKMEAVGRLAGGVAHDFNNLLTAIKGYTELVLLQLSPGDPLRDDLEEIEQATERARALTSQLLTFSRKQVRRTRVLDLNSVIEDMEKMLRRLIGEDIELHTALEPTLGWIQADPGQIEQVLMNLAVNARDAMPRGGRLTLRTANATLDGQHTQKPLDAPAGRYVRLTVSDTGIGMDEEIVEHVFEPFFTTKDRGKGTGLGLATVYGIVTQNGGHIDVGSEPGQGTTFEIYLPQAEGQAELQEQKPEPTPLPRGTETILLVEDEQMVRELARRVLSRQGYTVLEASHPGEALLIAEQHPDPIHLLLTDVVMPGIGGPELAGRLAQSLPAMKVLYTSGYTDNAIIHRAAEGKEFTFLQKPFTSTELACQVREVLDAQPTPG